MSTGNRNYFLYHFVMGLNIRLREALNRRNLKSVDLARATGIGTGTIGDWISGKSKSMVVENAVKVCEVLDVTQDWLFFGKGSMDDVKNDTYKRKLANQLLADLPEFAIDEAIKRITDVKEFVETVKKNTSSSQ